MERRSFIKSGLALCLTGSLALHASPSDARTTTQQQLLSGPQLGYGWIKVIDMDWQPIDNRPITPPVPYVKVYSTPGQPVPQAPYVTTGSGIAVGEPYLNTPANSLTPIPGTSTYTYTLTNFDTEDRVKRDYISWAVVYDEALMQNVLHTDYGYFYVPVTCKKKYLTENQAVDSRLDMRYSSIVYQDVNFKDGAYRGGLYVGNNSDGSKVGRSYLKFPVDSGDVLWPVGYVYAFKTRFARTGTISVKARKTPTTWDKQTLVWTNAPAPQAEGYPAKSVAWDSATPISEWSRFRAARDIETATGNVLSLSLLSETESDNPWAYFARKEWLNKDETTPIHPPYLLYAVGGPGAGLYTDPDPAGGTGGGSTGGGSTGGGNPGGGGGPVGGGGFLGTGSPKKAASPAKTPPTTKEKK
jgi:hypothetical protein